MRSAEGNPIAWRVVGVDKRNAGFDHKGSGLGTIISNLKL